MKSIRIALLVCDPIAEVIRQVHGDYHVLYSSLLTRSLPPGVGKEVYTLDAYDVCEKMEYPPEGAEGYDALLLSGSRWTAYDDLEWINKLVEFVREVTKHKPKIKIVGICFGHQIVGRALGGSCVPSGRWELGPSQLTLSELGKKIFRKESGILNIHQCHRDIVPIVPTVPYHFHHLAWTDVCMNHGMVLFEGSLPPVTSAETNGVDTVNGANYGIHIDGSSSPASTSGVSTPSANDINHASPTNGAHPHPHINGAHAGQGQLDNTNDTYNSLLRSIHIITVQGHPEYHAGIISALVDMRSKSGILTPEFAEETRKQNALELPIPGLPVYNNNEGATEGWLNEGTTLGTVIWGMLGLV